jgi:hypothetical protein
MIRLLGSPDEISVEGYNNLVDEVMDFLSIARVDHLHPKIIRAAYLLALDVMEAARQAGTDAGDALAKRLEDRHVMLVRAIIAASSPSKTIRQEVEMMEWLDVIAESETA